MRARFTVGLSLSFAMLVGCGSDDPSSSDMGNGGAGSTADAGPDTEDTDAATQRDAADDAGKADAGDTDTLGAPIDVLPKLRTLALGAKCAILPTKEISCWSTIFQLAS